MRHQFKIWIAIISLLAACACTKKGSDIEVDTPTGKVKLPIKETLRLNLMSEPPSLDWHKSGDSNSSTIIGNMMEGLTQYDLADKEMGLKPALALKWESSDQARKWKFTLRDGVVWSDGQPFKAQHVIDGWRRVLAKETASPYAYFLFGIKGAQEFNEGKKPWDEVGVHITGPNEITVELDKSMSYFPYLFTHHSTFPVRMDVVQKFGDRWTDPANIVTLGPFRLKSWAHDKLIALERNETYFGEKPELKYVVAYMIQEQATAINLFDSGKLDALDTLPSVELKRLRTRKEYREAGKLQTYFYELNVTKAPLDKVLVRRALAQAIDRQELTQMLGGGELPITSWIPAGMFGYEAERGLSFNPERARALLKQAGYADPAKLPKIEIKFNTNEDHQRIAENIQAQLKRNLGINVELRNEEWKVFLNTLKSDAPQVFRFGWLADYPDPDNFMEVMIGASDNNFSRWKNPRYDELVARGSGTVDRDERKKIYSEAQKLLLEEDVPVIPLFTSVSHFLIAPRVENYPVNAMMVLAYKGVRLKK